MEMIAGIFLNGSGPGSAISAPARRDDAAQQVRRS
jgi:hypothetical protein